MIWREPLSYRALGKVERALESSRLKVVESQRLARFRAHLMSTPYLDGARQITIDFLNAVYNVFCLGFLAVLQTMTTHHHNQ